MYVPKPNGLCGLKVALGTKISLLSRNQLDLLRNRNSTSKKLHSESVRMEDGQKQLQALADEYKKVQDDLKGAIEARQKLEAQQQENKSVQKEFAKLGDDVQIYKLVGPVLLKQDQSEATMAVDGRLSYIDKEM
jgi:prefoldin beta subunit